MTGATECLATTYSFTGDNIADRFFVCTFICSHNYETLLSMFTANATTAGCSPRWIIYPNSGGRGGRVREAVTLEQCLDTCVADSRCVALDWNAGYGYRCWLHDRLAYRYFYTLGSHTLRLSIDVT